MIHYGTGRQDGVTVSFVWGNIRKQRRRSKARARPAFPLHGRLATASKLHGRSREARLCGFLFFHLMISGMLLSYLLHPLILVFLAESAMAMMAAPAAEIPFGVWVLFVEDAVNISGSYLIFLVLGLCSMPHHEKHHLSMRWMAVPFYGVMTSAASWRALIELRMKPFFWQKTPHMPATTAPRAGTR